MPELETLLSIEDEVNAVLNDLGIPEKLSEMDDFMNQNDLKVSITNENAVVTGLVTYTCTVKDKDNNSLPNKVVEWYKGTTLLGMDATDSNGISTFSHRVTEADIYDVHAVVRGTHAGDDIRMFVKDKTNLLNVNQWSAGDYYQALNDFVLGNPGRIFASKDYSVNGDYSVKLTPTTGNYSMAGIDYTFEAGKTYLLEVCCLNTALGSSVQIRNSDNAPAHSVNLPVTNNFCNYSIEFTATGDESQIVFRTYNSEESLYVDNIRLTIL